MCRVLSVFIFVLLFSIPLSGQEKTVFSFETQGSDHAGVFGGGVGVDVSFLDSKPGILVNYLSINFAVDVVVVGGDRPIRDLRAYYGSSLLSVPLVGKRLKVKALPGIGGHDSITRMDFDFGVLFAAALENTKDSGVGFNYGLTIRIMRCGVGVAVLITI